MTTLTPLPNLSSKTLKMEQNFNLSPNFLLKNSLVTSRKILID
ncbi:Bgt-50501 [Blumeria graminis f. sp. tritici]|uniref:Bgt-50501 n=1 Tax=Blumeria graminis f. sp. tritici TaxID=62690 RepID=A0A9X9MIZ8_BLUGR|nr:Bgt-50501 [Blumeria graminis f. sp. tritici]